GGGWPDREWRDIGRERPDSGPASRGRWPVQVATRFACRADLSHWPAAKNDDANAEQNASREIASIREIVNISEPFIRRPIATSLLMAAVILLGLLGYKLLPISALPMVDFPTIEVTTLYPGA